MDDREPCPWRIVDDVGGAFLFGTRGAVGRLVGRGLPPGRGGGRWRGAGARPRTASPGR